jgi:hypothetical protein
MDANAAALNNKVYFGRKRRGDTEILYAKTVHVFVISGYEKRMRRAYLGTSQSESHFLDLH